MLPSAFHGAVHGAMLDKKANEHRYRPNMHVKAASKLTVSLHVISIPAEWHMQTSGGECNTQALQECSF